MFSTYLLPMKVRKVQYPHVRPDILLLLPYALPPAE